MGFLSGVGDFFFGDDGKAASEAQGNENAANRKFLAEQGELARGEAVPLFESAQQIRQLGSQQTLDIFGQAIPQQLQAFQQGNVAAQGVLGGGSQQFENAILGRPIDRSFLTPQNVNIDPSFLQNVQLPQFQTAQQVLSQIPAPVPPPQQPVPTSGGGGALSALAARLAGRRG